MGVFVSMRFWGAADATFAVIEIDGKDWSDERHNNMSCYHKNNDNEYVICERRV